MSAQELIERVVQAHKDDKVLAGLKEEAGLKKGPEYEKDPKFRFLVYKLRIEEVFTSLKDNKKLREFPAATFDEYETDLNEISGGFYDLYGIPTQNKLNKDVIQPKIDGATRKLSAAMSYIKGGSMKELKGSDLDECLEYIMICRSLLFELKEYLVTIKFDKPVTDNP